MTVNAPVHVLREREHDSALSVGNSEVCFQCLEGIGLVGAIAQVNVSIDDASAEILRKLGDGDLSLGIRLAAARIRGTKTV